jgi:hypothetical protein
VDVNAGAVGAELVSSAEQPSHSHAATKPKAQWRSAHTMNPFAPTSELTA